MIEVILNKLAVPAPTKRNCYSLSINIEHGDADFKETNGLDGSLDDIMPYLRALNAYFGLDWNTTCAQRPLMKAMVEEVGETDYNALLDLVGYDKKYESACMMARPTGLEVRWFNEAGAEYLCKVVNCRTYHGEVLS